MSLYEWIVSFKEDIQNLEIRIGINIYNHVNAVSEYSMEWHKSWSLNSINKVLWLTVKSENKETFKNYDF